MTSPRWPIELLAPARDLECGLAAIEHGADAVYIGAPRYGARAAASNSLEDIERLIERAHRYWVRVYVAMNTLLIDAELEDAVQLARHLATAGVDGLIIQDVGLLECDLPESLPLIASTQMHNRDPERVRFWSEVGLSRAILARELSLEEIRTVRALAPDIELECFVHGALCVSFSGQCWLSHTLGGRSGNRGECAQPCRKPYSLEDSQGRRLVSDQHLLSLCDLDLSAHLAELLDAGVTSLKIEGRLKNRAYVATTVAAYRRALDPLIAERGLSRASSGHAELDFEPDPQRVFHRGQTTYFLSGRPSAMASLRSPKSLGSPVGRVARVRGRHVELSWGAERRALQAGDGLVFFDRAGGLRGTRVNVARGSRLEVRTPDGLESGIELYCNHDRAYLAAVEAGRQRRSIAVALTVRSRRQQIVLDIEDADGVRATVELSANEIASGTEPGAWEMARDQDRAREVFERQLRKLGDTEFVCTKLCFEAEPLPHLPRGPLNELRRALIARLRAARGAARAARWVRTSRDCGLGAQFPERQLDYRANVLNEQAAAFYRRHGAEVVERAPEAGTDVSGRPVMTTRYCIPHELGWCPRAGGVAPAEPPYFLVDSAGRRLRLEIDCRSCEMCVSFDRFAG